MKIQKSFYSMRYAEWKMMQEIVIDGVCPSGGKTKVGCQPMNELKPEDVMRALELQIQRYLMPNVDIDGTVSVEDAERWFLKLLKEELAPYISALLREKDKRINELELTLAGVMWSVDKWLDGEELEQDEVNRAIKMREKTLRIVEEKDAEIERLQKHNTKMARKHYQDGRAEAITEFAERIKRYYGNLPGKTSGGCVEYYVDQIVKEMTEREAKGDGAGDV